MDSIDETHEQYDEIYEAYQELKVELENFQEDLYTQEQNLNQTKVDIEENEIFDEYEEIKQSYEEFDKEYQHTKDMEEHSIKLSDDEKKELKSIWKKACKLCHPDIVAEELKEKAHNIMQTLNEAYNKKDISQVKKILNSLENGSGFELSSDSINDKEILNEKIEEFRKTIKEIEDEIEEIKDDETFTTIKEIDDWDKYFEELKTGLNEELENLVKEAKGVLEDKATKEEVEDWIQRLWNWADENNISSGKLSRKKENLIAITSIDFKGLDINHLPNEICNLENIKELILWDCDLNYLPRNIISLENLIKLNIRGNKNLKITNNQKVWIDKISKKGTVFQDKVGYVDYFELTKLEQNENGKSKVSVEESIDIVYKWILNQFDTIRDQKSLTRIYDEARKVANDLNNNKTVKINLNYILTVSGKQNINIEDISFNTLDIENSNTQQNKKTKALIQSEVSDYSNHILKIENIKFEKIRRYCEKLSKSKDADTMQEYLANNGKMHKALVYSSLETFIEQLNNKTITLVDWGCDQGIGSMLVLDYIKEKQLDIKVNQILLIDTDNTKLSRAMAQAKALDFHNTTIKAINSNSNDSLDILKSNKNNITLNLIINNKMPFNCLDIDVDRLNEAYFMVLSNNNKNFVDEVYKNINSSNDSYDFSIKDCKIGRFTKYERIFKILNITDDEALY